MSPDKLAVLADRKDLEGLRSIQASDIGDFLRSMMSAVEEESTPPNADKLISLGVTLAKAGHESSDRDALEWLNGKPSSRRVGIVAAFLNGLWQIPFRSASVPPESARLFLQALRVTALDDDAMYMSVLALSVLMIPQASKEVKVEVAGALREMARHKYLSPAAARLSQSVIEKALQRAGV
jgi:hypothetical protein